MNIWITYAIIAAVLLVAELLYFKIADKFNIIDKPNERSSHSTIVLRGGGIIFTLSMIAWAVLMVIQGRDIMPYLPFLCGLVLIAGISFVDDIHSLPDSLRMVVQVVSTLLMFMLVPIALVNRFFDSRSMTEGFIEPSYLVVAIIGIMVFSIFNFRPKGKAKCFAGDVGSIGIAFIILFALGRLMLATKDVTWIVFFLVYGIDGTLTIIHRIMLHENLGQAHRKHAYQLMANELGMSHVVVSLIYMSTQLVVSLGFIYLCPNTLLAHWIYLISAAVVLALAYVLFMKKYYHLHEEYLKSLEK